MYRSTILAAALLTTTSHSGEVQTPADVAPAVTEWHELDHSGWEGKVVDSGSFDLAAQLVRTTVSKELVEGTWIRTSATTQADSADFSVWIHVFDEKGRPLARPLPTVCELLGSQKRCSNSTWIQPGGSRVRLSFYSGGEPATITPGAVEQYPPNRVQFKGNKRFNVLADQIADLYYRTEEVNWESVREQASRALRAPADVDPVPTAISTLVSMLPGSAHSFVFRMSSSIDEPSPLPSCTSLGTGVWRLDLPGTPSDESESGSYLARAHDCLSNREARVWLVNLTDNYGGDVFLQFAALAPLLGSGPQMQFTNPKGEVFVVSVDGSTVKLGKQVMFSWNGAPPLPDNRATFAIGPGCGSSCEAVAIAVSGRFRTVGQPTAGMTTANETLPISDTLSLAITSGVMTDLQGRRIPAIQPDVELDDDALGTSEQFPASVLKLDHCDKVGSAWTR